jgi:hypothetical protein
LINTTLPVISLSFRFFPLSDFNVKLGAGPAPAAACAGLATINDTEHKNARLKQVLDNMLFMIILL